MNVKCLVQHTSLPKDVCLLIDNYVTFHGEITEEIAVVPISSVGICHWLNDDTLIIHKGDKIFGYSLKQSKVLWFVNWQTPSYSWLWRREEKLFFSGRHTIVFIDLKELNATEDCHLIQSLPPDHFLASPGGLEIYPSHLVFPEKPAHDYPECNFTVVQQFPSKLVLVNSQGKVHKNIFLSSTHHLLSLITDHYIYFQAVGSWDVYIYNFQGECLYKIENSIGYLCQVIDSYYLIFQMHPVSSAFHCLSIDKSVSFRTTIGSTRQLIMRTFCMQNSVGNFVCYVTSLNKIFVLV